MQAPYVSVIKSRSTRHRRGPRAGDAVGHPEARPYGRNFSQNHFNASLPGRRGLLMRYKVAVVRGARRASLAVMCAAVALGGCGEPIDRTQEAVEVSSTQSIVPLSLGGPVILGGDDLTDHGGYNPSTGQLLAGWIYIKKALQNIHSSVTRSNDG